MSLYFDIISGRRPGALAGMARASLRAMSFPYSALLAGRNWFYDYLANVHWLDRPCVSIGNLTTGGTGKTPVVIWLADQLIQRGHKVAVLSRGYKGDDQGNDELQLVTDACPKAICIAAPDRVSAGNYAITEHDVDILLLDDGFQHRRIGRDLDIVLIDASCPFGHGCVLPRGLLRESLTALGRAHVIIITRLSQTTPDQLADLKAKCKALSPDAEIIGCDHAPVAVCDERGNTEEIDILAGQHILAFSGIGNPGGFERTLSHCGARPIKIMTYPDHHRYTPSDCHDIAAAALTAGAELLLTTEKDLVKLARLQFDWPVPLRALRIRIDFAGDGDKMLLARVQELVPEEDASDAPSALPADRSQ